MKRTALRTRKAPVHWLDPAYAALQRNFADTFDDRVTEDLVDYDDEYDAIEVVAQRLIRTVN